MSKGRLISWRGARRLAQLGFLLLFLYLFRATELDTNEHLNPAGNLFFRIDPLTASAALLGGHTALVTFIPALLILVLTAWLGRFFCGWVCPLGTLLDLSRRLLPRKRLWPGRSLRPVSYALLTLILVGAPLGLPLVGFFDPLALLTRALTFWGDPTLSHAVDALFGWLYNHAPNAVTRFSEPIYAFLRDHLLAFRHGSFRLAWASLGILAAIVAAELLQRRFWCRNLCPLGAMLGLCGRQSPLQRVPARSCGQCRQCEVDCRMGAFDAQHRLVAQDCTLCMDCLDDCPKHIVRWARPAPRAAAARPAPTNLSRRALLVGWASGVAMAATARGAAAVRGGEGARPQVLRPPGALPAADFLNQCVRCGECMKVCPTQGLQPSFVEAGIEGMFSPRLVPRQGYCEYACNLCSQVCPTHAIAALPLAAKQQHAIGLAVVDTQRCLPYAEGEPCICCEEHCPLSEKAIQWKEATVLNKRGQQVVVQQPWVIRERCIGCGICENKCPLDGDAGIRVRPVLPRDRLARPGVFPGEPGEPGDPGATA